MKNFFIKLRDFIVKLYRAYKAWLNKKKVNKHANLIKKRARMQYKIKSWDDKFATYFKKVESKKRKLQNKLHKINKKLGKLDKVFEKEHWKERENKKEVNVIESLEKTNKNALSSTMSLESKK